MTNQPAGETTYYQQGSVTITSSRAVFWQTTYPLSNITSVRSGVITPSSLGALIMGVVGVVLVIAGFSAEGGNQLMIFALAAIFFVGAFFILRSLKPSYAVAITTSGTDKRAYMSRDKAEIEKIVAALNEAIIKRG